MSAAYDTIRSAVLESGSDSRVEVNQRALIDKILARYASAGAVYRELLQNSNDAEATTAEVRFTTSASPRGPLVTEVAYRNDGLPFRPQDWSRLRKIAEGNPDVSKVGAFGVGAYTMFSICEEPLVVSGGQAMAFSWKGDALWVKLAPSPAGKDKWTTFVLPSRDLYLLPDMVEFGQFLCASLTFTNCLASIRVFVDGVQRLSIQKRQVGKPRVVTPPKASSWWSGDGAVTTSPKKIFTLGRSDGSITETVVEMSVDLEGDSAQVQARYISAVAHTRVPSDMAKKMERVTKKRPPPEVKIEVFIDADVSSRKETTSRNGGAAAITDTFAPKMGAGRVFIGFRTSQTTGLAAHLAAPLLPTVEREAIDFQDPTLRVYNLELLSIAGILMRLTLEHSMSLVGQQFAKNEPERLAYEEKMREQKTAKGEGGKPKPTLKQESTPEQSPEAKPSSIFTFAKFMSNGVKKIADVIASVDILREGDSDLMSPPDARPLSTEEHEAILLMRSFSPQQSTPDDRVGAVIAKGFESCFPELAPPVLTNSGVVRGTESRLPFHGIEAFVKQNVVRSIVLKNAASYLLHVAGCRDLTLEDLRAYLTKTPLSQDELATLLRWWTKYARASNAGAQGVSVKHSISFYASDEQIDFSPQDDGSLPRVVELKTVNHYFDASKFRYELPMPASALPKSLQQKIPSRVLTDRFLDSWFTPIPFQLWAAFICKHTCLTEGRPEDAEVRLKVLATLSHEYSRQSAQLQAQMRGFLVRNLSSVRCIPVEGVTSGDSTTDFPKDLYLSSAELAIFNNLGSFKKVSPALASAGVSDDFLVALGVRKTISMDFLFTQLDSLKWNRNPKPLVSYLRSVSLTAEDIHKLRSTQYLPEVHDKTRTYAPFELFLPNAELEVFPFVKLLQWPSTEILHVRSPDAEFLKKLGCKVDPPLEAMITFLTSNVADEELRDHGLRYVRKRLGAGGSYEEIYTNFLDEKFLPVTVGDPFDIASPHQELQSPSGCYSNLECGCLGLPILDTDLVSRLGRGYAQAFRCAAEPPPRRLVHQLLSLTSEAKNMVSSGNKDITNLSKKILRASEQIFRYMSSRAIELDKTMLDLLARAPFIPHWNGQSMNWCRPNQIYFQNANEESAELTEKLFLTTRFSPFLAAVGVRGEPSTEDILRLLIASPQTVLDKLGSEANYKSLLRRIAANPRRSITREMRNSPFLLAYRIEAGQEDLGKGNASDSDKEVVDSREAKAKYTLASAQDICIIDNSYFSRLFNVLSAPQESDLEKFYESLGSAYLSKKVEQQFVAVGGQQSNTPLTTEFVKRLRERRPLLVSSIVSRPLVPNAGALLDDDQLDVYEVSEVKALYTFRNVVKAQYVTCSASTVSKKRLSIFVTQNFDWFHVGNAIGSVILLRCNVQDAFFIGSLLETPLPQLRARGFPVDRILRSSEPLEQRKKSPTRIMKSSSMRVRSTAGHQNPATESEAGFESILQQMFPDCQPEHIRKLLGQGVTLDKLRSVADILAEGNYPRVEEKPSPKKAERQQRERSREVISQQKPPQAPHASPSIAEARRLSSNRSGPSRRALSKRGTSNNALSRAFRGIGAGLAGIKANSAIHLPDADRSQLRGLGRHSGDRDARHRVEVSDDHVDSPPDDAGSQRDLEGTLKTSVRSSRPVSIGGISTPPQEVVPVPESVERSAAACEVIPAQELKPFEGASKNGMTSFGIRVFSARKHAESERFLTNNWEVVESFSFVLKTLCSVYELRLDTVAIFHDPMSRTIAFNAGRALHFNVRYFASLHWRSGRPVTVECYSYWFTTMAHELAHNLAIAHAKKHGHYTEAYISTYVPKLLAIISRSEGR